MLKSKIHGFKNTEVSSYQILSIPMKQKELTIHLKLEGEQQRCKMLMHCVCGWVFPPSPPPFRINNCRHVLFTFYVLCTQ